MYNVRGFFIYILIKTFLNSQTSLKIAHYCIALILTFSLCLKVILTLTMSICFSHTIKSFIIHNLS